MGAKNNTELVSILVVVDVGCDVSFHSPYFGFVSVVSILVVVDVGCDEAHFQITRKAVCVSILVVVDVGCDGYV